MSDWGDYRSVTRYAEDDGTAYRTQVNANSVANTKGSTWTTLFASTPFDADSLTLVWTGSTGAKTMIYDLGVGIATSEVVLVPNLLSESQSGYLWTKQFQLPIAVPAGTRLSARGQSNSASADNYLKVIIGAGNGTPCQRATEYGCILGTSRGTIVQCSGTLNTFGSWYEITSSTTDAMRMALFQFESDQNNGVQDVTIQVGIGGTPGTNNAPDTTVLAGIYLVAADATMSQVQCSPLLLPFALPAATRIAMRGKSSAGGLNVDCSVIGFM